MRSKTQNSGVVVIANTSSFVSAKNKNPVVGDISYFEHLVDIINWIIMVGGKLHFSIVIRLIQNQQMNKEERVRLHTCQFYLLKIEEPFILASQAIQVFYVEDPIETDWHAVVFTKPRDLYDMDEVANVGDLYMKNDSYSMQSLQELIDNVNDVKDNVSEITLDSSLNIGEGGENHG
ncbi:hypothetical protein ACOSP7_022907 [Xanthoceras sorbifolium]